MDKQTITTVFHRCDEGHKNFLTREDLKIAVVELFGYNPSKVEVDEMMQQVANQDQESEGMDLNTFLNLMLKKLTAADEDDYIRQVFLSLDSHCNGFLTSGDLRKAVSLFAPRISAPAPEAAFREIDRDGDGRVSYKDFEFMMKYSTENGF